MRNQAEPWNFPAIKVAKHVAQRLDHEFLFPIAIAVHLMRRRSGLVLPRQLCALRPRMRTER
jgi:hypothetical protein